ncbi:Gluconate transport-inducing protein [Sorochytrium milnesiophthora]
MATYKGKVVTAHDALLLIEACRQGILNPVRKRLSDADRNRIAPGHIYVFDEKESGIKRWSDGRLWSSSRMRGCFLVYVELRNETEAGGFNPKRISTSHGGLLRKKAMSVSTTAGERIRLVSYYVEENDDTLRSPSDDPKLNTLSIPEGYYLSTLDTSVSQGSSLSSATGATAAAAAAHHSAAQAISMLAHRGGPSSVDNTSDQDSSIEYYQPNSASANSSFTDQSSNDLLRKLSLTSVQPRRSLDGHLPRNSASASPSPSVAPSHSSLPPASPSLYLQGRYQPEYEATDAHVHTPAKRRFSQQWPDAEHDRLSLSGSVTLVPPPAADGYEDSYDRHVDSGYSYAQTHNNNTAWQHRQSLTTSSSNSSLHSVASAASQHSSPGHTASTIHPSAVVYTQRLPPPSLNKRLPPHPTLASHPPTPTPYQLHTPTTTGFPSSSLSPPELPPRVHPADAPPNHPLLHEPQPHPARDYSRLHPEDARQLKALDNCLRI